MPELVTSLGIAVFSFLFGAIVTAWWNRARPLVLLEGFTGVIYVNQVVPCTRQLSELSDQSWTMDALPEGDVPLSSVKSAVLEATEMEKLCDDALAKLPQWQEALRGSPPIEKTRGIVREALTHRGMSIAIATSLLRSDIVVAAPDTSSGEPPLAVQWSEEIDGGCYAIVWKSGISTFGTNLSKLKYITPRLEPFIVFD